MLKELSKYENLGTPSFLFELLKTISNNPDEVWYLESILSFFRNRVIDDRRIFDGCLPLLNAIGVVSINFEEKVLVEEKFILYLESEHLMIDKLTERLMIALNSDSVFHDIFCSEFISYDVIYRLIQIDNAAFPLKYSNFKQLLIDFNILQEHPTRRINKYIINSRYKKVFDKMVLPEIKKRKIGIEELQKSLEQNQIHGEEAEKFVLKFEENRLNGEKEIDWVAEYSASDGYDIASYETTDSIVHDRFIEVKSFIGEPYFFWSRNEMDIARIKRSSYFLYLVDRSKISLPGYSPIIIQDPHENVLMNSSQWEQRLEKIRFQKII